MDPASLAIAFVGILLGGFLKGATGAGAPVVGVPVLALVFDVPMAVAVFSVLNLFSNIWQSWAFRAEVTEQRFTWTFAVMGALGAALGSVLLASLPVPLLMASLAGVVFAYIGLRLARPNWVLARARARKMAPYVGLVGGVMQGAGGLSAPVSITFLNALNLPRKEFIATIAIFFLAMSVTQVPALAALGILTWDILVLAVFALIPMFLGIPIGSWAARFLSKQAFDRLILSLLAVIAVKLIWDATQAGL
ncbi:sulfite exporter TauE/SafE family protein [Marivita sp.]|uniref:sulfite exporter TauE/SafE family protein n=1 Tax=Marivita sp. TaxID=2003365 RepID=UPI003F6BF70A